MKRDEEFGGNKRYIDCLTQLYERESGIDADFEKEGYITPQLANLSFEDFKRFHKGSGKCVARSATTVNDDLE
jgi:hypothetical protein